MKSTSSALAQHLDQEVTTLATCWRVERTDGAVLGFTDHDRDLEIEGVVYQAASGYQRTAIASNSRMAVDNLDLQGILDSEAITPEDLRAGRYDRAEVRVFLVNWQALGQGILRLRRGWLGDVTLEDGQYRAELRGLTQILAAQRVELYSPECRADLGDERCKVDLGPFTRTGAVTGVGSRRVFTVDAPDLEPEPGYYDGGVMTFTSGANQGLRMEIKSLDAGTVELFLPMPWPIEPGDQVSFYPGCDKRIETCHGRFANVVNFRGEAFVPGQDRLMKYEIGP
jgi:uncharacterized phage protein (TIGR02218 family)